MLKMIKGKNDEYAVQFAALNTRILKNYLY